MSDETAAPGLDVRGLTVRIAGRTVLDDVTFAVPPGRRVGVIGASGSGKSMTSLALMGLEPAGATVTGSIRLDGRELVGLPDRERARTRGAAIGMVFQEPGTALDPLRRVGKQIVEPLRLHRGLDRRAAARGRRRTRPRRRPARPGTAAPAVPAPALRWAAAADLHRDGDGR